jgi:hypothetical protein
VCSSSGTMATTNVGLKLSSTMNIRLRRLGFKERICEKDGGLVDRLRCLSRKRKAPSVYSDGASYGVILFASRLQLRPAFFRLLYMNARGIVFYHSLKSCFCLFFVAHSFVRLSNHELGISFLLRTLVRQNAFK